jgi:hypothetical protein
MIGTKAIASQPISKEKSFSSGMGLFSFIAISSSTRQKLLVHLSSRQE